jgi:glycerol-3-phosphate O-acyltransferase/dihydroxyacetone phosphate acyltransferase
LVFCVTNSAIVIVPVVRPQDLATPGAGAIRLSSDRPDVIEGIDTAFKEQTQPKDLISVSKTLKMQVEEVISENQIRLSSAVPEADASSLKQEQGIKYKIIPHVDQHDLFDKVHDSLAQGRSIVIFPEGGSHDRLELLPLKGEPFREIPDD